MRIKSHPKRIKIQDPDDLISGLPDDLLQMILSKMSIRESVKTCVLSKRWEGLWRWRSDLVLDMRDVVMRETCPKYIQEVSVLWAKSMTKVMNNHQGTLENCTIHHNYPYQSADGTLAKWIQTATSVKQTKCLTLVNHVCGPKNAYTVLRISPKAFSNHSLISLALYQFKVLSTHHGFNKCSNLKVLKLNITVEAISVLSRILAACSSLEMLLLQINLVNRHGVLKIENKNLKYLQVATPKKVDGIEVNATSLVVLDMRHVSCKRDRFILKAPNLLFNRDYWLARGASYLSCNVSHLAQRGDKSNWLEFMRDFSDLRYFNDVRGFSEVKRFGSLSVSLDVTNPKEVDILKEVLLMWCILGMIDLEVVFKTNNPTREEGKCSTNGGGHKQLWEDAKPFPNADFRVRTMWIYNFSGSNKNEFALVSGFVKQKTVTQKIMIETSSMSHMKKIDADIAIFNLMQLSKGGDTSIQSF